MAFVSALLTSLIAVALFPLYALVSRLSRQRSLWYVPGPASVSLLSGILSVWFGEDALAFQERTTKQHGRIVSLTGFLGDKILYIADTKALYEIFVKNTDDFEVHEGLRESTRLVFGGIGLFSANGDVHRRQRKLMNPAFSINHMRRMMPTFQATTQQLVAHLSEGVGKETVEIDIMDYTSRLALELIAQAGLGHSFGAIEGKDDGYGNVLNRFETTLGKLTMFGSLLPVLTRLIPGQVLRSLAEILPWPTLHEMLNISDTMQETSREIWKEKKRLFALGDKSVVNEYGEGKDIMMNANLAAEEDDRLADHELLAQINTFTLAAADTTSSALARILYLLALHPDVQERLREELTEACDAKGEIGHDHLVDLPLLEAVCRETLRLYPPVSCVFRQCVNDCMLPLAHPYTDTHGFEHNELFVPGGGTMVIVNIVGVNRDKATWGPDAEEWRPERWLSPLPDSVTEARVPGVYANLLTFIGGGHACIGFKFAQLEMKVALSRLVPSFRFAPSEREIVWRFGGAVTPSVKGSTSNEAELPLLISPVMQMVENRS
ncbi:cytochrome P450 [Vararia minispora EC-137]|uniref:Cytochrome P450 n=1 Tax=Vararia minispora EC-137 TaxID=1314806 RepID=A0ACB8Q9B3_9AGAM|nr:cytochrome P450 [Vararia minispora EC-137]